MQPSGNSKAQQALVTRGGSDFSDSSEGEENVMGKKNESLDRGARTQTNAKVLAAIWPGIVVAMK